MIITKFDNPIAPVEIKTPPMNLQLFGDETAVGEGNSTEGPAEAAASPSISDLNGKVQDFFNSAMNPPAETGGQAEQSTDAGTEQQQVDKPAEEPLILGKFKSQDELIKAYTNLESFNTQTRQELAQLKQQQENQSKSDNVIQKEEVLDDVPDNVDPEALKEELLNKFYEDPLKFVEDIQQQATQKAIEKMKAEREAEIARENQRKANIARWDGIVKDFRATHPDMDNYSDDMLKFLDDNKEIAGKETAIELAYNYAKGLKAPKSPDELLSDPEFIQKAASNENFRKEILKQTAADIKKGSPPPVISGNSTGGKPVATEPQNPKSFKEAGQMMLRSLGLGN